MTILIIETNPGEVIEKGKFFYSGGGNVNSHCHLKNSIDLKVDLLHD